MNIRPWDKTLYIQVVRGFLREDDRIAVRFGDPGSGSPGMRMQTFCESTFEFRVLVDAIATYNYVELPVQPHIAIVPGAPARWQAILPTERAVGERFRLCLKGEDAWGNPIDRCDIVASLRANVAVAGLPETVRFTPGEFSVVVDDLSVAMPGDLRIELLGPDRAGRGRMDRAHHRRFRRLRRAACRCACRHAQHRHRAGEGGDTGRRHRARRHRA